MLLSLLSSNLLLKLSRAPCLLKLLQLLLQPLPQLPLLLLLHLLCPPLSLNSLAASFRTEGSRLLLIHCSLTLAQLDLTMLLLSSMLATLISLQQLMSCSPTTALLSQLTSTSL